MPKISALTSLAQADVVTTTDVLPIVDATAPATTKKVTVQAMVNAGLATLTTLPSGIVNASLNSITPTGGTLGVTGTIAVIESGTGGGEGGITSATQNAGGNAGVKLVTGGAGRWAMRTLGAADGESLSFYKFGTGAGDKVLLGPDGSLLVGQTTNPGSFKLAVTGNVGVTGAFTASGNASFQANAIAQAGLRITGAAPLDANDGRLFAYEAPVTKFYVGDGTGYSFAFSKRAGGVSTDLVTITDAGALSVTGSISATSYIEGAEQTAPAAPAANGYRIFAQDNGAGKTQLMVIFASGAAQQIAIEP